jgi:hypothetical protein
MMNELTTLDGRRVHFGAIEVREFENTKELIKYRKLYWQRKALDTFFFKNRINDIGCVLNRFLDADHRQDIYNERHAATSSELC